jgi:hypothetical protein
MKLRSVSENGTSWEPASLSKGEWYSDIQITHGLLLDIRD